MSFTELSISAILAPHSRSPKSASWASRSACCTATRCPASAVSASTCAARALQARLRLRDLAGDALLVAPALVERGIAGFHLGAVLVELGADLGAALGIALQRLERLQVLDLGVVVGLLARADLRARFFQRGVALRHLPFEALQVLLGRGKAR